MRKLIPALLIAASAAVGVATPAMAAEETGPAIHWAGSIEENLGHIQVSASSTAGVTGITAHIIEPSTGTEVGVMASFHLASGTDKAGVWHSDGVDLPDLGYYTLNIEADDADGGHTEAKGIGTLAYTVRMYFVDLKTTSTLTYTRRNYQVSGKLMGRWPGTGNTAPVAGMPIYGYVPGGSSTDAITGAKGQFSMSGPVDFADAGPGYISTGDDPTRPYHAQGFIDLPEATIKPTATRVTIDVDRKSILSGESILVSGTASWKSPEGWAPMSHASIAVGACPRGHTGDCFSGPSTSTDANGRYSFAISPYDSDLIRVAVTSEDIYVERSSFASTKITVLMPSSFAGFSASRDTETGKVVVGAQGLEGRYIPAGALVSIQFSANGATGWRTTETIDLGSSPSSSFYRLVEHRGAGYWRLNYAGIKGVQAPAKTGAVYVG